MSDDRKWQARVAADRRLAEKRERMWEDTGEHLGHSWSMGFLAGFREAAEWVDASPKPRTLTADEFEKAVRVLWSSNDGGSMESWGAQAQELLSTLGIEVEDNE